MSLGVDWISFLYWGGVVLAGGGMLIVVIWIMYQRNNVIISPPAAPIDWRRQHEQKNIDISDFVDEKTAAYKQFELEQRHAVAQFEVKRREELTAFWAKIEGEKREKQLAVLLARDLIAAEAKAEQDRVKIMFGENLWLLGMGEKLGFTTCSDLQRLADVVYTVVFLANREFGGYMPIKKTWHLCRGKIGVSWAESRAFYENLSGWLFDYGFLVGHPGRWGRKIKPGAVIYLKSLTSLVQKHVADVSRPVRQTPENNN